MRAMDLNIDEQAAQARFAQGRLGESVADFERLSRLIPERLDLRARLGYLALLANDLDAAVEHLAQAINQGLRSRKTLAHLAEAYYRKGRLDAAAYCYQRLGREGLAGTLAVIGEFDAWQLTPANTHVEIPLLTDTPLPVITVQVNGRYANLVLDTGAGDTVLDSHFAVDAGVRLGGQEQRSFAGGMPALVTYAHVEQLVLNGLAIEHIPVQVIDLPHSFGDWFPDLSIHGILGSGLFSRFRTTLDYCAGVLRLATDKVSSTAQPANTSRDQVGVPIWLAENQLLLTTVALPAHKHGVWFVDSGMTGGAFAVPGTGVETLELEVDESDVLVGTGGGGTVHGHKLRVDWLKLDQLRRYDLAGVMLDSFPLGHSCGFAIQGLIGHELLREAVLTLDFPAMRLHLVAEGPA
ncbi:MAG: aspartyl protease family protein [Gammaproteobacteria bacterium]|nr:aspartyl protease family protein [Gammaproteobacteria bacterium]